jgi:hypothetical protein
MGGTDTCEPSSWSRGVMKLRETAEVRSLRAQLSEKDVRALTWTCAEVVDLMLELSTERNLDRDHWTTCKARKHESHRRSLYRE